MLSEALRGVVAQRLLPKKGGKGRCAAIEILSVTSAVSNLIREGKTFQLDSIIQTGKKAGMISLDGALQNLVTEGLITVDEAIKHAKDKGTFQRQAMGV